MSTKYESSAPTGLPVRGSRMPVAAGATRLMRSIPFERPLLPLIYEADSQHAKEQHHRPEAEGAELTEGHRPREQEGHFEVENDEQNCDQIEPHIELHARIVEGVEATLVRGKFLRVGVLVGNDERRNQQSEANGDRHCDEDDERQIIQQ